MTEISNAEQAYRPFLKWAGGKYSQIDLLKEMVPKGKRLIEPFVGSGVVFANLDFAKFTLGEINPDLVALYEHVQQEGQPFIDYCQSFFIPSNNCKERYLVLRTQFNSTKNRREKAALFLYLNRHGYNGLCRYNSSGIYNVPFGQMPRPYFPLTRLQYFHERLQKSKIVCQDFSETMLQARKGDVIYCDPPYVPLSATANFSSYSAGQFGPREQETLASLAERLAKQGIPVVISNHDTEYTRSLYKKAKLHSFPVRRYISCNGEGRNFVQELLAIYR